MTKPTGRPRGRPKSKEYSTLMARFPQDLAARLARYASRKRMTVSDVLRDAVLTLLQEDDPYRQLASDRNAESSLMSDSKEESSPITSDTKRGIQGPQACIVSDRKKDNASIPSDKKEVLPALVSDTQACHADILSDRNSDDKDYDPTTHSLGKMCPRKHEYRGTGQSVLRLSNRHCRACDREKFHERKQAKRQPR